MVSRTNVRRYVAKPLLVATLAACGSVRAADVPPIPQLKPLCLETDVVRDGQARATIVVPASGAYDEPARRIVAAVEELTGVELPVVKDDSPDAALPLDGHAIALGNRSTNRQIGRLYDRYYTLLDLRYPGAEGHVVRTLHNPLGRGFNVIFAGASDRAGVERAADVLIERLREAAADRAIRLGRLAAIRLGDGIEVPRDVREVETWGASAGYGSVGYFGWNSLSKRLALYYMTGDEFHAREFLRLAFPDEKAKQEIAEIDGERIEDKDHPLSGPYHYNAHMMILLWDLVEESPAFSDEERLRVTRAFSEQVNHWAGSLRATAVPRSVGSRHGQWDAISLYCLARYFRAHYPDPFWERAVEAARLHFGSLHDYAYVSGENDNLFWYNTAIAPIFTYLVLTGDRVPLENGVVATLIRGQEALISGRAPDWALNSASIGYLHKAAYLTQDGRWLTYRDRTGVDLGVFRVGQSFWPEEHLKPEPPKDLLGKWTLHRLSKPKWESRGSGLPLEESFEFGSFRSRTDAGGDFLLLDGFNGASRNPYHTLAVLEMRLAGYTLLRGYLNQVITRVDGLMEPKIAMDAALERCDVIGSTALAVGQVPDAAYANWRRTIVQRIGRYALVVDELTFREDSPNADVSFEWETERGGRRADDGRIVFSAENELGERRTESGAQVVPCDRLETTGGGRRWTMRWSGPVKSGERKTFFSLVGIEPGAAEPTLQCYRSGPGTAALALPEPAMAAVRAEDEAGRPESQTDARLAVWATDHFFATGLRRFYSLIEADKPIDVDWDLEKGVLHVVAADPAEVGLFVDRAADLTDDGEPAHFVSPREGTEPGGLVRIRLVAGRHVVEGAFVRDAKIPHVPILTGLLEAARESSEAAAPQPRAQVPDVATWEAAGTAELGSAVVDLETIPGADGPLVAAAEGSAIHLLSLDGRQKQTLAADGPVRMLRWWPEARLLLAGCADEKVIAFDASGNRRWVFVSEMDPAVFRAAKTYWFKSAPGHEGIHGLSTGTFLDGRSQTFVGSACTLEILDREGKLLNRMPQFWGKVSTFALIDGPGGTRNLLAARKYNGTNTVAIVNSATLNPSPRGFISVPPGHTYMPGWSSMNRYHLFYEDLDGDGTREVVSEINGTWNRVCVWSAEGKPLHAANFGPGPRIPARTMRDLDVCDLDGDGKREIVAATSRGMVVALDHECRKRWAERLARPAEVLACVHPKGAERARTVLGCDDGRVRVLDAAGKLVAVGSAGGRPACLERLADGSGEERVVLGTKDGTVSVFAVGP